MKILERVKRTVLLSAIAAFIMSGFQMTAYAAEEPDLSRTISVAAEMKYNGNPVGGGSLTLYQVGDIVQVNGDYGFAWIQALSDCGLDISNLQSPELASKLPALVQEAKLAGQTKTIGTDGKVCFDGLKPGLYLVVQERPAAGYAAISPFLVSGPVWKDDTYLYTADASPKLQLEPVPSPTASPTPVLIQTGQLLWPVPVLALLGLLLFAMGWYLRFGKRKE